MLSIPMLGSVTMILSCGTVTDHRLGCALVTCFVLLDACCMFIRQCQADVGDALLKGRLRQVALPRRKVEDHDDRLRRQQVVIECLGQGVVENGFHVRIFPLWLLGRGVIIVILFSSRSIAESKDLSFRGGKFFPSKSFPTFEPKNSLGE